MFDLQSLNPQRRVFDSDSEAQIRGAFQDLGCDLGDPRAWSSTAVNLNVIDMSYQGWVPADIALRISNGSISHAQIPLDFHHTAYDDAWLVVHEAIDGQALG